MQKNATIALKAVTKELRKAKTYLDVVCEIVEMVHRARECMDNLSEDMDGAVVELDVGSVQLWAWVDTARGKLSGLRK